MGSVPTFGRNLRLHVAKALSHKSCFRLRSDTIFAGLENTHFAPTGFRPRGGVAASCVPVVS